ncbi:hypothetical protein CXB51_005931 [Gossypium anomalum]|uniref:DUF4283 domain-containing protein n=1 Tax=Gossypium anomalum TaxID=47600 RepID=A0A8J5ZMY6_9ROSI|nr:hypothetical protein CXB51_005931 [Gossypium anomalum]
MSKSIIIEMLGRKIRFNTLSSKLYAMWKPTQNFKLMDLDNDYYIVKFQAKVDSEKALVEGLMVVYGQYLVVQPWTPSLNIHESFSMRVVVWVKLPCFLGMWYKKCLLKAVESTIEQVIRVDDDTENRYRGRFARITVCVDFRRSLITKIRV